MALLTILLPLLMIGVLIFVLLEIRRVKKDWSEAFKGISYDLLKNNQESWSLLSKTALENSVNPLQETLKRYELMTRDIEAKRNSAEGALKTEIAQLLQAQQFLQKETSLLVNALTKPQVGGSWGELSLKRLVELAGMIPYCDFEEQVSIKNEDGRLRPDMVIHLPGSRDLVVDSKLSMEHYAEAFRKTSEADRKVCLQKHAQLMRDHLKKLSAKSYWSQFERSPDFVIMFIPGDPFLSAALTFDPLLLEDGFKMNVFLSTPSTLMALLRVVAYGWRQEETAQNAQEIGKVAKEFFLRIGTWMDHLKGVGESLDKSVKAYNQALASFESRVTPTARKLETFGLVSSGTLPEFTPVSQTVRTLQPLETTAMDIPEN